MTSVRTTKHNRAKPTEISDTPKLQRTKFLFDGSQWFLRIAITVVELPRMITAIRISRKGKRTIFDVKDPCPDVNSRKLRGLI